MKILLTLATCCLLCAAQTQPLQNSSISLNISEDIGNFSYGFFKELFVQMNQYNASICVSILPLIVDGIDQIGRLIKNKYLVRAYLKLTVDVLLTIERSMLNCGTLWPALKLVVNYTMQDFSQQYWTYLNLNILKVLAKLAPLIKNIKDSVLSGNYLKLGANFGDVYYLLFINIRPPSKMVLQEISESIREIVLKISQYLEGAYNE